MRMEKFTHSSSRPEINNGLGSTENSPVTPDDVRTWADLVFLDPINPQCSHLRSKIVSSYLPLADQIKDARGYGAYVLTGHADYGFDTGQVIPLLLGLMERMPETPSLPQMEVAGITALLQSTGNQERDERIDIDQYEFQGRLVNSRQFGADEDWLTSLGFITKHNEFQHEAFVKGKTRRKGLKHLNDKTSVSPEEIDVVYQELVRELYPGGTVPTFRDYDMPVDSFLYNPMLRLNIQVYPFLYVPDQRKRVQTLLNEYNSFLKKPAWFYLDWGHAENLAYTAAAYFVVHPHPDGNNSMARLLIDNYSARFDLPLIDWQKEKTDYDAYNKYRESLNAWRDNNEQPLNEWFYNRIRPK